MTEICCICGKKAKTVFKLPYIYPDNIGKYTQHIGICEECGFIFTQNPFTPQQLEDRYKNNSKYEYDSNEYSVSADDCYVKRCRRQKDFIYNNIKNDFSGILEIGAASGYNLSLYTDKNVFGIEPSEKNCRLAKQNYNVDLYNGMFSDYLIGGSHLPYDLIFMSHTLEHIVNPYELIKQCRSICGKYIFIEVPTMDYKFLDEPMGMFCEEHVNYFTLESLTKLMESLGFELIDVNFVFDPEVYLPARYPAMSTLWKISENNTKIRKIPAMDSNFILNNYITVNKTVLNDIKAKIDNIDSNEKLALWGAGHHASMLLANTSLADKNIVKIYDGDKRKHSSSLNGVKISAFDQSDIYEKKIDSVLVTTYTAQKSISKILEAYKNDCKIYYLYDI